MLKYIWAIFFTIILTACGDVSEDSSNKASMPKSVENKLNDNYASMSSDIEWYQDKFEQPIKKVGAKDVDLLIKTVGVKPVKIENSSDEKGEPKQIYLFSKNVIRSQLEYSPNMLIIAWYQASDDEDTLKHSQESLKTAYLFARAVAGDEGAKAVRTISMGGKLEGNLVSDYSASGQCAIELCLLRFELK